jgi:hypothetical protein
MLHLGAFEHTVAIPSVAFYTQLDVPPRVAFQALARCGFSGAASISGACDESTVALELFLKEPRDRWPLLSSECPTVVRLVQARYPALVDRLVPLLPPREIAAREARRREAARTGVAPDRIGVVYITPCPSKMVSILEHPGLARSHIDAAVSFVDLFPSLVAAVKDPEVLGHRGEEPESARALGWAWAGGRSTWLAAEDSFSVAGLANVIRILDDVEEGKLRNYKFISAMACVEGCVSGTLTVENPYVARARAIRLTRSLHEGPLDRGPIERRYRAGAYHNDEEFEPRPARPLDDVLDIAIDKMSQREHLARSLPGIDCGACGAPSCAAFADDVVSDTAELRDCMFLRAEGGPMEDAKMNVHDVVTLLGGRLVAGGKNAGRDVCRGYASDLLSDVMANAGEGALWVTLQRHANIVAVASVRDLSGIVLVAGREPEGPTLARADEEGVPLIVSPLSAFDVIGRLHRAGLEGS